LSSRCNELNPRTGSVVVGEDLICYAAHIRFVDRIDLFQLPE
jgi:hypothetical protein